MKIKIHGRHSLPGETGRCKPWSWLRLVLLSMVSLSALLATLSSADCLGAPLPRHPDLIGQSRAEIPFEIYSGNLIVVRATIGLIKNVNMILDTGTSPTAINKEMAERLNLRGKTATLQMLNETIQAQSVIVPRIQIGSLGADSLRVVVLDLRFMERRLGISLGGLAGLDLLSTGNFTIDYRRRKIVFGPIAASEQAVRFETLLPSLTVEAKIEGHEVRLIVDSGTEGLVVYRNRLQTSQQRLRLDSNTSMSSPGGRTTQTGWFRAGVTLGNVDLGPHNVTIVDADADPQDDFDGLLGFAKMGFRRVSFDFDNGLFGWE